MMTRMVFFPFGFSLRGAVNALTRMQAGEVREVASGADEVFGKEGQSFSRRGILHSR